MWMIRWQKYRILYNYLIFVMFYWIAGENSCTHHPRSKQIKYPNNKGFTWHNSGYKALWILSTHYIKGLFWQFLMHMWNPKLEFLEMTIWLKFEQFGQNGGKEDTSHLLILHHIQSGGDTRRGSMRWQRRRGELKARPRGTRRVRSGEWRSERIDDSREVSKFDSSTKETEGDGKFDLWTEKNQQPQAKLL